MEAISDKEARNLASDWVKKIRSSVLAQINEDKSPTVVSARSRTDDTEALGKQDSRYRDEGRINFEARVRSSLDTSSDHSLNNDLSLSSRNAHRSLKERNCNRPFEFTCSDQSKHIDSKLHKGQSEGKLLDSQLICTDQHTPKLNVEFIRQRRLAFFDNNLHNSIRSETKPCTSLIHEDVSNPKLGSKGHSACCLELYDKVSSCEINSSGPDNFGEMFHSQAVETSTHPLENVFYKREFQLLQPDVLVGKAKEDEEIRLELWGLKDAIDSGQLDLKAYIKEPAPRDSDAQSVFRNSHEKASKSVLKTMGTPTGDSKGQVMNSTVSSKTSKGNNEPKKQSMESKRDNFLWHHCNSKVEESRNTHCFTGNYSSNLNGWDEKGNGKVNDSYCLDFSKPQINGPLYCGFENSDSESSLLSFGSRCDEVYYRKVVKKSDSPDSNRRPSQSEKQDKRPRDGKRTKEKILMELTNFIEGIGASGEEQVRAAGTCGLSEKYNFSNKNIGSCTQARDANKLSDKEKVRNTKDHYSLDHFILKANCKEVNLPCDSTSCLDSVESCGMAVGKICPKCKEVNSKAANWCIECGTALISVKSSCLTSQQQQHCKEQYAQTQTLIKETINRKCSSELLFPCDKAKTKESDLNSDTCISHLSMQVAQSAVDLDTTKQPRGNYYKRHWMKSSTAWSSFNPGELSKSSSFLGEHNKFKGKQRSNKKDNENLVRASSASELPYSCTKDNQGGGRKRRSWTKPTRQRTLSCNSSSSSFTDESIKDCQMKRNGNTKEIMHVYGRPSTVQAHLTQQMHSKDWHSFTDIYKGNVHKDSGSFVCTEDVRLTSMNVTKPVVPPLNLQDIDSYDRILTLIRTQRDGDPVPYLYLPDEILLKIFSFLSQKDLVSCSGVCWQFCRISMDESLWKVIIIKKNHNITDECLFAIGKHRPTHLTISQCHGGRVTTKGLRELFRSCNNTLEELNFSGCRGGELIGESILLHVAARCRRLRSVDASWSNVGDNGIQALVDNVERLECLCLNGCPAVTDESIKQLARKHGKSLRIFEIFGCFNISPAGIQILGQTCKQLQTLNIGQCQKITDPAIGSLVSNLSELENLDLRGCKQARDSAVKKIVRFCPHLTNLVLANCPYITDVSLTEIATNIPKIRSLDICGCAKVTDNGVRALSKGCRRLELLDLTSTGVSHKSVLSLANYCSQTLCNLKLSFCSDICDNTVAHLAKQCKRLTTLHLYGCKRIRNTSALRLLNPALTIEC